jgi:hypothetical protein
VDGISELLRLDGNDLVTWALIAALGAALTTVVASLYLSVQKLRARRRERRLVREASRRPPDQSAEPDRSPTGAEWNRTTTDPALAAALVRLRRVSDQLEELTVQLQHSE